MSHDSWLLSLDHKRRHLADGSDDADATSSPPESKIPDADQGALGKPPGSKPARSKDDWLIALMDSEGTKTYGD